MRVCNAISDNKSRTIDIVTLFFSLFLLSSLSGYGRAANYVSAGFSILIIFICIKRIPKNRIKYVASVVCFYFYYVITSITNYSSLYYLLGTCILYTLVVFTPLFLELYWITHDSMYRKKQFFRIATYIWFLIVIVSIVTYYKVEEGGRTFVNDHTGSLLGGGYCAAYASAIIAVILFGYLYSKNIIFKKRQKVLLICGLILSVGHVIITMSAITTVAMLIGIIFTVFFHGPKSKKVKIGKNIFMIAIIGYVLYIILNKDSIGLWLIDISDNINNATYSQRLAEVGRLILFNEESHHVGNRVYTLTSSWSTFLEHPIFGIGYKYGNDYTLLYQNGVGVHSDLLDSLAKHGLIGSIPYFYLFYFQLKKIILFSNLEIGLPLVCTFLILFAFNTFLSSQTIFALFLYIPLLISILENKPLNEKYSTN